MKIGDKVREQKGKEPPYGYSMQGQVGVIEAIVPEDIWPIKVQVVNNFSFQESELELVEPVPSKGGQ
ncbi:unnamed protein product [marine sediment metagenome]|uniref:Uncharacterized protein n=1 Tax=marine sediment metagenome TaxID=412755 RepID=X0VVT2_9ZZZZ